MKIKKYLAQGLTLGIIIINLSVCLFANNIREPYYDDSTNINTKENQEQYIIKG